MYPASYGVNLQIFAILIVLVLMKLKNFNQLKDNITAIQHNHDLRSIGENMRYHSPIQKIKHFFFHKKIKLCLRFKSLYFIKNSFPYDKIIAQLPTVEHKLLFYTFSRPVLHIKNGHLYASQGKKKYLIMKGVKDVAAFENLQKYKSIPDIKHLQVFVQKH